MNLLINLLGIEKAYDVALVLCILTMIMCVVAMIYGIKLVLGDNNA